MNVRGIVRPYCFYRPRQIWRRIWFEVHQAPDRQWVELPWGLGIWVNSRDDIGQTLLTTGINDLTTSECLFRLADPGELAVDVGANIGYTTSILRVATGVSGRVISFEPHPTLNTELRASIAQWKSKRADVADVTVINQAASDHRGEAVLSEPASFEMNRGIATLQRRSAAEERGRELRVETIPLDTYFANGEMIGVLKVDVEGHETQVFKGARNLLSDGHVRDVIFEELAPYPAETHKILEEYGFEIFVIVERLRGPELVLVSTEWKPPAYSAPNYVATRDV